MEAIVNKLGGMDGAMKFLRDELKLVAKNGKEAVIRALKNLAPKGTVTVPMLGPTNVSDFFAGKLGVKIYLWDNFRSKVLNVASHTIACPEHKMDVFHLMQNMYDSTIQKEIGATTYKSVDEYLASIISRIMMWKRKEVGHGLLDNGYANIEHIDLGDRVVAVHCSFGSDDGKWFFSCNGLGVRGRWRVGYQFSSPALGC